MSQTAEPAEVVIAYHVTGAVSQRDELNGRIGTAWKAMIADRAKRSEIAKNLGLTEQELTESKPLFEADIGKAGFVETVVVIVLAKAAAPILAEGFLKGAAAFAGGITAKAAYEYLRSLWTDTSDPLLKPGVEFLGPRADEDSKLAAPAPQTVNRSVADGKDSEPTSVPPQA